MDNAFEKARAAYGTGAYDDATLEFLFPQLKESEDERIRKWLIDYFKNVGNTWIHREISPEQILSYLEKQKDHFRDDTKMVEQKPAEWSEEDEKNLELIIDCIYTFYPDPVMKYKLKDWLKSLRPHPQGTYKQVIHTIFGMLKDKDFYEIQPSHRVSLLNDIRVKCKDAIECAPILDEPSWKPSEEQMGAFCRCVDYLEESDNEDADIMAELYEQLKQLKQL